MLKRGGCDKSFQFLSFDLEVMYIIIMSSLSINFIIDLKKHTIKTYNRLNPLNHEQIAKLCFLSKTNYKHFLCHWCLP